MGALGDLCSLVGRPAYKSDFSEWPMPIYRCEVPHLVADCGIIIRKYENCGSKQAYDFVI